MNPYSGSTDFSDGELKTNKTYVDGRPKESIAVCMIKTLVSQGLFADPMPPYSESYLCRKLSNTLVAQVVKDGPEEDWYILALYHFRSHPGTSLFSAFAEDYNFIVSEARSALQGGASNLLHTTNGRFLQIRTKDAKPYSAIFCPHNERIISLKNFAFYLQASFMRAVIGGTLPDATRVG